MNFLKLFAAGKGLIGMRSATSPYRMRPGGGLPKFGSSKNPFSPPVSNEATKAELCKPEAVSENIALPVRPATGTVKLETAPLFETQAPEPIATIAPEPVRITPMTMNLPPNQPVQPELRPAAPAPSKPAAKRIQVGELVKKLNPLAYLPDLKPGASRSRAARPAVQGELSLEKVKVVRNDLSDSDLEIVPVKSAMKLTGPNSSRMSGAAVALDEATAWDRLTSRFFNTEETQVR